METKYLLLGGAVALAAGYWWWSTRNKVAIPTAPQIPVQNPQGLPPGYPAGTPGTPATPPTPVTYQDPAQTAADLAARQQARSMAYAPALYTVPQDPR